MARFIKAFGGDTIGKHGACSVRLTARVGGGTVGTIVRDDRSWGWVEAHSLREAKRRASVKLSQCAKGEARQWPPRDY